MCIVSVLEGKDAVKNRWGANFEGWLNDKNYTAAVVEYVVCSRVCRLRRKNHVDLDWVTSEYLKNMNREVKTKICGSIVK